MTPAQASKKLNLSPQQVRWLIRKGYLVANRVETPGWGPGYYYWITPQQITSYTNLPRDGRGHPTQGN
jgi:hypothetical protein